MIAEIRTTSKVEYASQTIEFYNYLDEEGCVQIVHVENDTTLNFNDIAELDDFISRLSGMRKLFKTKE